MSSLTGIFTDEAITMQPADTLIQFIENYCVEAADIFMPSKSKTSAIFVCNRFQLQNTHEAIVHRLKNSLSFTVFGPVYLSISSGLLA